MGSADLNSQETSVPTELSIDNDDVETPSASHTSDETSEGMEIDTVYELEHKPEVCFGTVSGPLSYRKSDKDADRNEICNLNAAFQPNFDLDKATPEKDGIGAGTGHKAPHTPRVVISWARASTLG